MEGKHACVSAADMPTTSNTKDAGGNVHMEWPMAIQILSAYEARI